MRGMFLVASIEVFFNRWERLLLAEADIGAQLAKWSLDPLRAIGSQFAAMHTTLCSMC
jgi:hypothetical protein